jgi:hypothetical protein
MRELLEEVLKLQKMYSSKNTSEMERRGILIRREIPNALRALSETLARRMGRTGEDLEFEGRDSTGPKSEIPWVRLYSEARSPNAREGWYCVLLFAGDGSGFYLSLGHGSTRWEDGNYKPRSEKELREHVTWAREILSDSIDRESRLLKSIDLRFTRSKVADAYERGTALAIWYDDSPLPSDEQFRSDLEFFSSLLSVLYDELDLGRTPDSTSLLIKSHLESVRNPRVSRISSNRQGWGLSAEEKRLVERHSMLLSERMLIELGYSNIEDTSKTSPYDFLVRKDGIEFIVEVKGTTGTGDLILLTVNEVEIHRTQHPNNILIVVHSIDLDRSAKTPTTSGGQVEVLKSWIINESQLRPLTFSYDRKGTQSSSFGLEP